MRNLVEETKNLTTSMLGTSLFVIHDTSRGGQDQVTELTSRQQVSGPLFELGELDVETGRDNTTLVDTTVKLNNDLTGTVIINDFELTNVTMLLHDRQELDNDLRRRTDENLSLSTLLSVVDVV